MSYVPLRKAVQTLGLHPNTLRKYADEGKIETIRNEAGQRLFNCESYIQGSARTATIGYCRVSSNKQKDDLARQEAYLPSLYPEAEIVILLPTFETSQMSKKGKRRIKSNSVRQMLTLSHYRFKECLKCKAFEYKKVVLDVNEAYTSKTVSWTGEIVSNLGGAKTIESEDGRKMDRDLNGARGIFLRALVDTPWLRDNLNLCVVNES